MSGNPLYKYLKDAGYWYRGEGSPSHLFLDKGKAYVPQDMTLTFNNLYAYWLQKGKAQYAVEQKTPVFKYFVDLDICTPQPLSSDFLKSVALEICSKTIAFFEVASEAIVCSRVATIKDNGEYKTGIHLFFPSICTDSRDALFLRQTLVKHCTQKFTELPRWDTVIDSSIYKANGIRMIGSQKKGPADKNVYMPSLHIDIHGNVKDIENPMSDIKEWVRKTSIRYFGKKNYGSSCSLSSQGLEECEEETCTQKHSDNWERVPMSKYVQCFPRLIELLPAEYKTLKFTGMYTAKDQKESCFLLRSDSKYCMNKGGCHTTTNVYFVLNKKKKCIYQRCYCTKETCEGRKYGYCKDYSSRPIPLGSDLSFEIFGIPKVNVQKNCMPLRRGPQPIGVH